MKNYFLFFPIVFYISIATCQTPKVTIRGSWLNSSVQNYYGRKGVVCNLNSFASDVEPLCLTFKDSKTLNIMFKLEQKIFTYKVIKTFKDSLVIYGNGNKRVLVLKNGFLMLDYHGRTITFEKVLDIYSKDPFAEFVKGEIFKDFANYKISFFDNNNDYKSTKIRRDNFELTLKKLFKCDYFNIVTLGLFEYQNNCLPEIAMYYKKQNKLPNPRTLGIVIEGDCIKFVDAAGLTVMALYGVN